MKSKDIFRPFWHLCWRGLEPLYNGVSRFSLPHIWNLYYNMEMRVHHLKSICSYIIHFISRVVNRINRHRLYNRSAELAYYLMMAILTLMVTFVYGAHFMPNLIQNLDERFLSLLPEVVQKVILSALIEVRVPKSLTVIFATTCTAIWFASRAMFSMMVSFSVIYHIDSRAKLVKAKLISILFTLALVALFLLMFFFTVVGSAISDFMVKYMNGKAWTAFEGQFFRLLTSVLSMMAVFTMIYFYLPNKRIRFVHALPGAVFVTVVWFGMAKGFSYYVNNLNAFSWILGSLGSIFIFLIWVYYSSIFILVGAEINAVIEKRQRARQHIRSIQGSTPEQGKGSTHLSDAQMINAREDEEHHE